MHVDLFYNFGDTLLSLLLFRLGKQRKIHCSFLSECSFSSPVLASLWWDRSLLQSYTSIHSTNTHWVLTVCLTLGAVWIRPLASLWGLTASWKRREKIQVNKHQLMRKPVCEELVEESFGQKEQGVLILRGGHGLVYFGMESNGPIAVGKWRMW